MDKKIDLTRVEKVFTALKEELSKVIMGQETVLDQVLYAILADGHVLLEGVPGLGKSLLANTLAKLINCSVKRIQFTPDLMPSDIIGTTVYHASKGEFQLKKGPVFSNILLADEINRSPAKTQSALLQAMQEKVVSIDGNDLELGKFFITLATQNPIELEGTYPLPEAQTDRFLIKILIEYPSKSEEIDILKNYRNGFNADNLGSVKVKEVISVKELIEIRELIAQVTVDDSMLDYITDIVHTTRNFSGIEIGASPRASVALFHLARVKAAIQGRDFVVPDDVKDLVIPALRHRCIIDTDAEIQGKNSDYFLRQIINSVEVPR